MARKDVLVVVQVVSDSLSDVVDSLPLRLRQHAQDYLTEGRLTHRTLYGLDAFMAQLRGYHDSYHPWVKIQTAVTHGCDCGRNSRLCPHVASLILDLTRDDERYPEVPFSIARQYPSLPAEPNEVGLGFWEHIAEDCPPWRKSPTDEGYRRFETIIRYRGKSRYPLDQVPAAAVFAEADSDWLSYGAFEQAFFDWLKPYLAERSQDPEGFSVLQWSQPRLPLTALWQSLRGDSRTIRAVLGQLMAYRPSLPASPPRTLALLRALTVLAPETAEHIWPIYGDLDPYRLHQAESLYLAGMTPRAIQLLEDHLPEDILARNQSRQRVIAWCSLEESLPHRLALAWETGSVEVLQPVSHLLSSQQWNDIHQALADR